MFKWVWCLTTNSERENRSIRTKIWKTKKKSINYLKGIEAENIIVIIIITIIINRFYLTHPLYMVFHSIIIFTQPSHTHT